VVPLDYFSLHSSRFVEHLPKFPPSRFFKILIFSRSGRLSLLLQTGVLSCLASYFGPSLLQAGDDFFTPSSLLPCRTGRPHASLYVFQPFLLATGPFHLERGFPSTRVIWIYSVSVVRIPKPIRFPSTIREARFFTLGLVEVLPSKVV